MKTVKSVIIFSQEYPPYSWGGVTPFTVNLVNGLRTLGIHVQLMTISEEEGCNQQDNGVVIYRIAASGIYKDDLIQTDQGLKRRFLFLKRAKQLANQLEKPDIIILADGLCFPEAKACALHFSVPLITMVHQIFADINLVWNGELGALVKLENKYFEESDHLIVASQYMKERMEQLGYAQKTTHINCGWGFQNWADKSYKQLEYTDFIFVGRMVPEKGVLILIDAFNEVIKKQKGSTLKLIGEGPIKELAYRKTIDYGIQQNVSFLGAFPWTQISRVFQSAKYSVVPSFNEPFGYVALETIMYGAIPIVSDACGLREIAKLVPYECTIPVIEKKPYVFYPDVKQLSKKMLEFLELDEKKRKFINHNARIKASQYYNFVTAAVHWIQLMESLKND